MMSNHPSRDLLQSWPASHDMHHGVSYNHNYGFYFTWWDKLMGTEHPDYIKTFDRVTARQSEPVPAAIPAE